MILSWKGKFSSLPDEWTGAIADERIPAAARRRRKRGCRLVKMGNEHPGEVKFDFFFKFCGCNPEFAR